MLFYDRRDAANKLAEALKKYEGKQNTIVVALPRGGVVLGRIVADALHVPLDIVVPRKIGYPGNEEYAIGALTETGDIIWNEEERAHANKAELEKIVEREKKEAQRRLSKYRAGMPDRNFTGKTLIIVDDGIATGLTMFAAIKSVRTLGAAHIIVAIPGGPADTVEKLREEKDIDDVIVLEIPSLFFAVGGLYQEFGQVEDEEVIKFMKIATNK
ncbi:phosphoribosyl transferase [Candidatus Uhrbacteria bacterium]|nr:phosphoribosyl transferase [Candidatus Uhrbacteria bacterium]